jgi:methionine synthase II (cobalamin-independent)
MTFKPKCMATAVGSLPHTNAEEAVQIFLQTLPEAPVWPQLPARDMNEQMEVQYSEGFPRVVIDRDKQRMYIDTSGDTSMDLATFYENFMTENLDPYRITPDFAQGIAAFEQALAASGDKRPFVKVQTTGPITFGLATVDENKRAIYYNPEFADVIVKGLSLKCRWQIRKFAPYADRIICFVDEPILAAFGSSTYVSVTREDVVAKLGEVIGAIHAEGALAGVHCCGNTEWSILIDAGADIINFDAFDFGETISLYPQPMKQFLDAGKVLAWGVVPTQSEKVQGQTADSLVAKLESLVEKLVRAAGLDRRQILDQAIITPSCGMGSLPVADAELGLDLLAQISQAMRERLAD